MLKSITISKEKKKHNKKNQEMSKRSYDKTMRKKGQYYLVTCFFTYLRDNRSYQKRT